MFKKERQQEILNIVKEKKFVSVSKLSKLLYVSLPTIRRDLAELERNGMVVRSRGGAMHLTEGSYEIPLDFRTGCNVHEKIDMCKKAARLISDGDIIYIDASSSTIHIADFITARNITAVTNGMPAAVRLIKKGIKTYFTGGEVLPASLGCGGAFSESIASAFNYNLAFFSSYGVNENGMIVDTSLVETALRKVIFKNCERKVFIYTKNKENLSAPYNVIELTDVDIIITDK